MDRSHGSHNTGWIYYYLKPHAVELKIAHPEMLKAITVTKKKNNAVKVKNKISGLLMKVGVS